MVARVFNIATMNGRTLSRESTPLFLVRSFAQPSHESETGSSIKSKMVGAEERRKKEEREGRDYREV